MAVKLTNANEPVEKKVVVENDANIPTPTETATPVAKTEKAAKPKVTSGVFMVATPDGSFKYIGTSSRIEICYKDYSKWLAEKKHGNKELQAAYDKFQGNLVMTILKECPKTEFAEAKKAFCKEHGVDMKVPFTKDIIKAADIQ